MRVHEHCVVVVEFDWFHIDLHFTVIVKVHGSNLVNHSPVRVFEISDNSNYNLYEII